MRTIAKLFGVLVLVAGLAPSIQAQVTHSPSNHITESSGQEVAKVPIELCENVKPYDCICCMLVNGQITWVPGTHPECYESPTLKCLLRDDHHSKKCIIDNLSFNHIHYAADYYSPEGADGCGGCGPGGLPGGQAARLPRFGLVRFHRYRDLAWESSFGPGAYSNFDAKLQFITTANNECLIEYFDPHMFNEERFVDGPYVHPFSPNDTKDGVYVAYKNNGKEGVRLYDSVGALTSDQASAKTAVMTTWMGRKLHFQVISVNGTRFGRLTKVEDRTGYGLTVAYKYQLGDDLMGSEQRLWQIDTVTDAYGAVATFSYHAAQVSGRWVVSAVDVPNGETLAYDYTDGYLSDVAHPDGTATTIDRSFDSVSNCTVVQYFDAAAPPMDRKVKAYLTSNYTTYDSTVPDDIFPQSASLVRMIVNGEGEVSYLNIPDPEYTRACIFEGNGLMKHVYLGAETKYATSWSFTVDGVNPVTYASVTKSLESTFTFLNFPSTNHYQAWYRNEPTFIKDNTGRQRDYLYNAAGFPTKITYPDTTFETFEYNGFNQVTRHIDRINRVTEYTYDSLGNMLTKTTGKIWDGDSAEPTPETATWEWEYFASGHAHQFLLKKATDANGNVTEFEYDSNHYLAKVTEAEDSTGSGHAETLFSFDAAGRLTQATDALGRVTQYAFDERNRVTTITYNDATTEIFTYGTGADANLIVQETDRQGNTTEYAFDASGRQIERVSAANVPAIEAVFSCTYRYGSGLRENCTDRGNASSYEYDYRNRVIKEHVQPNRSGTGGAAKLLTTTTTFTKNEVTRVSDPYGRRTHYVYAASDPYLLRTVNETTPSGSSTTVTTLARDFSNNAKFVIEDRTYDAEGQVLTLVDGRGIEDTFEYDSRGRMAAMVESARIYNVGTASFDVTEIGARTEYAYDLQGNRTEVKLPRSFAQQTDGSFAAGPDGNFITKYAYTGRNLLKSVTEAFGRAEAATESYTYWLDKRRKDRIDARGETWTTLWSRCCGFHKVEAQPEADADANAGSADTRAAFVGNRDSRNLVVHEFTVADWSGFPQDPTLADAIYHDPSSTLNEVTTKYDARRRPVARTVWLIEVGNVDKNDPTIAGTHGTNASDGLTTTWVYDEDLTDTTGLDATYAAHLTDLALGAGSVGSAVEETDPLGNKTVRVFDGIGRLVKTIDPNGNTRKIVYDTMASGTGGSQGNVLETKVYDGLNKLTKQRTDGIGRVLSTVDPDNRLTAYGHDANSNRVKIRDPNGVGMDCVFDARDREVHCTDTLSVDGGGAATGDVTEYAYDNHNNLVETTDAKSQVTTCAYDARDRKTSCTDRNSGVTTWQYDENSNLTALIDAESSTTTFGYDPRNLKVEEIYPGHSLPSNNERVAFGYDARGRMLFRLDQKEELTEYAYDRVDRLTTRTYPDTSVDTFTYDLASRLTAANCGRYDTLVERTYDSGSRLTSEKLTVDATAYTTTSAYDAADRRTSITYPNGKVVAQTFTTRDQLSNVKYDAVNVGTFVYDIGMRRTTLTFGNSKVETRQYRTDDRLTSINTPNVTNFTYTYDANKNPLTQGVGHNTTDNQAYDYDDEDRLVDFQRSGSGPNQAWQLSLVGDWDQFTNGASVETRTHNDVHELTAVNANSLSYDLKGNLTTNSNGQTYTWDFENLMESATVGADTAEYVYDAFRRRVKKTFDGNSTVFIYDGWRCISEYDNGAAVSAPDRLFVFGTYLDEVLMMRNAAGTKYYYHSNHLYSVHAITNASGNIVEAVKSYDAYGKPTIITGAGTDATWFTTDDVTASVSALGNPWFYTGQRLDAETGLMYYKNRYYSAELGRFISRDPIGFRGGSVNLFESLLSMPIRLVDGVGLSTFEVTGLSKGDDGKQTIENMDWQFADLPAIKVNNILGASIPKGRTFARLDIVCCCKGCPEKCDYSRDVDPRTGVIRNNVRYLKVECKATLDVAIRISDAFKGKDSVSGIYGHEQRHVQNYISRITTELLPILNGFEADKPCDLNEKECKKKVSEAVRKAAEKWYQILSEGHDTTKGGPEEKREYPPLGGKAPNPSGSATYNNLSESGPGQFSLDDDYCSHGILQPQEALPREPRK